jgi:hypothetical protein
MAMTTCRECEAPVAATAKTCPNCGVKHPTLTPEQVKSQAAASLAFNAGCLILIALGTLLLLGVIYATVF